MWVDSPYGLGGGYCKDVLRDGTAMEMVGRLCVLEGRQRMIDDAIAQVALPTDLAAAARLREGRHTHR